MNMYPFFFSSPRCLLWTYCVLQPGTFREWMLPGLIPIQKPRVRWMTQKEELANVWWSPKGAKLGEMAQCGWQNSPFLPLWGAEVMEGIIKDAAASSSMFMAGVSHPSPPSPSSFLILSRNSWCLTHSGSWDYLNDFQIHWDPQKNTYMLTLRCSPNLRIILRGFTDNTHSHPDPRDAVQRPYLKACALDPMPLGDYPHPLLLTFPNWPGFSPRSLASWTGTMSHSGVLSWVQEACVMHTWRGNSQISLSKSCPSHLFSPLEGFEKP